MKHLKYITLSLLALAAFASCSDSFLDKEPDERVTIDTEDKVVMLLISAYPQSNWGWIAELSSDNIIDNNAPHKAYNAKASNADKNVHYNLSSYGRMDDELFKFEECKSSTSTDSPSAVWESCYYSIATANMALEAIETLVAENDGVMSTKLKAARAEALLIRAYSHFLLVNLFCQAYKNPEDSKNDIGIPYATSSETTVSPAYNRGTVAEVYEKIQADLEEGLADMSDTNYTVPKWHFNTNAAHAFAARFYLYTRNYDKVIEHADAVLGEGTSLLTSKLMDYSVFDECTYASDFATQWQTADAYNNLMLVATYSVQFRRVYSSARYACSGDALVGVLYHTYPNHGSAYYSLHPASFVAGVFYCKGNSDYGFAPSKIYETFEYTDKVAGIGYCHLIRREFTATELLLDRAEAKLLCDSRDIDGAVEDLIAYEECRQSFSETNKKIYSANDALISLTRDKIESNYYAGSGNTNCFDSWSFTQNMSSDFVVPSEVETYMNCLNDFRRFETWMEGWRFFDLKRYGIEYSHYYSADNVEYFLSWDDPRRAIELPQEVLAAGMESSRPLTIESSSSIIVPKSTFTLTDNE